MVPFELDCSTRVLFFCAQCLLEFNINSEPAESGAPVVPLAPLPPFCPDQNKTFTFNDLILLLPPTFRHANSIILSNVLYVLHKNL